MQNQQAAKQCADEKPFWRNNQIKKLLFFTLVLSIFAGIYVLLTPQQAVVRQSHLRHESGEALGSGVAWLLGLIYGRTLLKLAIHKGPILERLLPDDYQKQGLSLASNLLAFLNKTHVYVGASAVVLLFGHAYLEGFKHANLLMRIILGLSIWQFCFGLFILQRFHHATIKKMKRYGYLAHSQLYTGITLGVCALFGHLLIGD